MTLLLFFVGLVLLVAGADLFVRGASRLALLLGLSPLVIGLTVVAYGTSLPELAVSVQSSWQGATSIAIGNVVGSNIANVLLILGSAALISPLVVSRQIIRLDVPLMIVLSLLFYLLVRNGSLSRLEGGLLFVGAVVYTAVLILLSKRQQGADTSTESKPDGDTPFSIRAIFMLTAQIIGGGLVLLLGSRLLVDSATAIATRLGLSELIIGLTVVAVGTSLPELATSIIAAIRGERDIAVGNVIGSNLFNIMVVLGLSAVLSPQGLAVSATALRQDIPIMLAVAFICLPIFITGVIGRQGGFLFLLYYLLYLTFLALQSVNHPLSAPAVLQILIPFLALLSIFWLGWNLRYHRHTRTAKIRV